MRSRLTIWGLAVAVGSFAGAALAQGAAPSATNPAPLRFASVFGDHMVLQCDMPVPVWGTGKPGDGVTVTFNRQKVEASVASNGTWSCRLPALKPSNRPGVLAAEARPSGAHAQACDVLVGEVWIASGQANMEMPMSFTARSQREIGTANEWECRFFVAGHATNAAPQRSVPGEWKVCQSNSISEVSGVAYYFGRDLRRDLLTPVGLIQCTWGGATSLRDWMPPSPIESAPVPRILLRQDDPRHPRDAAPLSPAWLYQGMIAPLCPFAFRGVIWYQGETETLPPRDVRVLFAALIRSWRQAWGRDFPFLFAQLSAHKTLSPALREAQLQTWRSVPETAMVVTTDIGGPKSIVPKKKEAVGWRLERAALAVAYGRKIEYSGPVYESVAFAQGRAILRFSHVGDGLVAKDRPLQGFEIAGSDRHFKPAVATIEADTVAVTGADVKDPVAVRYGWANVPDGNLFNRNGFPASPFRTDDWEEAPAKPSSE